jgi:hypothetical protein
MNTALPMPPANRRDAILIEVADALRAAGSGITSIQAVIAATTISSQEIADEFGDSSALMIALVEMLATSMLEPLDDCTTETSFQQKLLAFGNRVTDERVAPQLKCLYRIALTEVIRNTGTGLHFYKHGLGLVTAELARFFRGAQAAGIVLEEDSRHLASHFMALLRADLDLSGTLPPAPSKAVPREPKNIPRIIELFCAGIQSGAKDAYAVL